jgi:glyoxylase-like metal-dependent hydrolase (beta-lactamase superfamily II)
MIDCGADWEDRLETVDPTAIVLTHAHSDHAFGLGHGADCPVYATEETWSLIERFPLADRRIVEPQHPFHIGTIGFEAFSVEH